jgi:hypothetical protein
MQFGYTTVFGAFVTYAFARTGNIAGPILCHAFSNWMGFPAFDEVPNHRCVEHVHARVHKRYVPSLHISWILVLAPSPPHAAAPSVTYSICLDLIHVSDYLYHADGMKQFVTFRSNLPDPHVVHLPDPHVVHLPDPHVVHLPDPRVVHLPDPHVVHLPDPHVVHLPDPHVVHLPDSHVAGERTPMQMPPLGMPRC